jgi:capsular polysaccharide export protein
MHILFLQGTASRYMEQVGRALVARGHRVARINLHFGERIFWRLPATNYRGRPDDWRAFIARFLEEHRITHVFVFGDRRPYHRVAIEEARARAIKVVCSDLGYLRPDWLTLESGGSNADSGLPRAPSALKALGESYPQPVLGPRFHTPFWRVVMLELQYQLPALMFRPLYPGYRRHTLHTPVGAAIGWLRRALREPIERRRSRAALTTLRCSDAPYFLFPLQLSTDFQIRAHSRFRDMPGAARVVLESFAAAAPMDCRLLIKMHPLDYDRFGWRSHITATAEALGIAGRIHFVHGGDIAPLIDGARGLVVVNSTSGLTGIVRGRPVMALGNAVYGIPGLTHQGDLASFWTAPCPPDPALVDAALRVLAGRTQIRGGLYSKDALAVAVPETVRWLEEVCP